jgi:isopentenyl-diphosphate delta-isomerase
MKTDTTITKRKDDHIQINLSKDVQSKRTTGLERLTFIHEALPEINLVDIDLSSNLFGKEIAAPILISSMTGGTDLSKQINQRLAEVANEFNIPMGLGSQRIALEIPESSPSFYITRKTAPNILLFANLGAIQLNSGFSVDHCKRAIDMIGADGLILHLNPLQESLQENGNTNFASLSKKIELICRNLPIPVIVKEVGWGISKRTAKILWDSGVSAIDVAGAGGTSWSQVEMHRTKTDNSRQLASTFDGWGIPTVSSIKNVLESVPNMKIIASGGLQSGLDITKCIALGAVLGGMAGKFLQAASESTNRVRELVQLTIEQIRIAMFCIGADALSKLSPSQLSEN